MSHADWCLLGLPSDVMYVYILIQLMHVCSWIMMRKLRLPATNALVFQKCLVDREVNQLLQVRPVLPFF